MNADNIGKLPERALFHMGEAWEGTKPSFENLKGLSPKKDVGEKLNKKEKMGEVGKGLLKGTVMVLRGTVGTTLIGLSMITPKKQSDQIANAGLQMMGQSKVGSGYGANKRERVTLKAKYMWAATVKETGKAIENFAVNYKYKNLARDTKWKRGDKLQKYGTEMKHEAGRKKQDLEDKLTENKLHKPKPKDK